MFRKILNRIVRCENITRGYSNSRTKLGPELHEFLVAGKNLPKVGIEDDTYLSSLDFYGNNRKVSNYSF